MTEAAAKPHAIHWRINSVCNRRCPFCYGPEKIDEAPASDSFPILDKMLSFGIDTFILTGGEPMLSPKFEDSIRFLHANGAKVVLYTNCDFWDRHDDALRDCLDTLCLPLEGASEYTHDQQRGQGSMRNVLKVMNRYANGGAPFKIKVGTVVGRHNIHELPGILYVLEKYKINVWKLYEYIRYSDRTLQRLWDQNSQGITAEEYRSATQVVVKTAGRKTKIGLSSELDRDQSYFMLNPNLDVIVPMKGEDGVFSDRVLCRSSEVDMEEIQKLWMQAIDWDRYVQNLNASLF